MGKLPSQKFEKLNPGEEGGEGKKKQKNNNTVGLEADSFLLQCVLRESAPLPSPPPPPPPPAAPPPAPPPPPPRAFRPTCVLLKVAPCPH